MLGIERVVDEIFDTIHEFQFFFFVDEFEEAIVLRAGKYDRTVGPGAHWLMPVFEDVMDVNVKPEPVWLDTQTFHTKDDYLVTLQMGFEYRVTSPRIFLTEYEDTEELIAMHVSDLVLTRGQQSTWKEITDPAWRTAMLRKAAAIARKHGAQLTKLAASDLASGEANRLWVEGVEL